MSPLQMQDEVLRPLLGTSHQDLCWVSVQAFLGTLTGFLGTLTGQALPLRVRPGASQQHGHGSPIRESLWRHFRESPPPRGGAVAKDGPSSGGGGLPWRDLGWLSHVPGH